MNCGVVTVRNGGMENEGSITLEHWDQHFSVAMPTGGLNSRLRSAHRSLHVYVGSDCQMGPGNLHQLRVAGVKQQVGYGTLQ